ncbi:hypothetical protein PIB30_006858 [Stylosanthes scabra]|uniref:Uncharacterized protein n=1 Tax=Stylosanthes scabra TaxID=79078 RepID=A0ABU6V2P7_9FABA|nr:hypothetical protein [Stylosanthes scabra]
MWYPGAGEDDRRRLKLENKYVLLLTDLRVVGASGFSVFFELFLELCVCVSVVVGTQGFEPNLCIAIRFLLLRLMVPLADPDFGSCWAKALLDHIESVLANELVTIKNG